MTTFSVLTLNCYGVPAPGTKRRLSLLAHLLNEKTYSAVCLQEVQSNAYRKHLIRSCNYCYPAHTYEPFIHAPKGGLLTLSSLAIQQSEFVLYEERGLWYTPAFADWILHKGILISRIQLGNMLVVLMNTHLTANYTGDWSYQNLFARHEYQQLQQLSQLVQMQPLDALVVVCGDFNIPRGSWLYDSFLESSGLYDPLHGDRQPTLRARRALPTRYMMPIDFCLFRSPHPSRISYESRIRFKEKFYHEGRQLHLSDHYAIELLLTWDD